MVISCHGLVFISDCRFLNVSNKVFGEKLCQINSQISKTSLRLESKTACKVVNAFYIFFSHTPVKYLLQEIYSYLIEIHIILGV